MSFITVHPCLRDSALLEDFPLLSALLQSGGLSTPVSDDVFKQTVEFVHAVRKVHPTTTEHRAAADLMWAATEGVNNKKEGPNDDNKTISTPAPVDEEVDMAVDDAADDDDCKSDATATGPLPAPVPGSQEASASQEAMPWNPVVEDKNAPVTRAEFHHLWSWVARLNNRNDSNCSDNCATNSYLDAASAIALEQRADGLSAELQLMHTRIDIFNDSFNHHAATLNNLRSEARKNINQAAMETNKKIEELQFLVNSFLANAMPDDTKSEMSWVNADL